jgi:cell fate regulator YaaT (PSP1 superfamily)
MSTVELTISEGPEPLQPVRSLVVRHGYLRQVAELPYDGPRPACGGKVVIKTRRGTELASVLTTTCQNTGCPKSISRQQMLDYMDMSGGRDYPFGTDGRVLRIADAEDLSQQQHLERQKPMYISACRSLIQEMQLPMRLVDVEVLLGGETMTFYFLSEHRVDFRGLVKQLAAQFHTRIQMHQVGSRDESRVVADFETCGQECCCRQFLKVLRPVNMGSAKMQKATLDPGKISGRCGRLKCCLRYEEETYDQLRRMLPRNGSRVRTGEGLGTVIGGTILTQLVKVRLDNDRIIAVASEELLERDVKEAAPARPRPSAPESGRPQEPGPGDQQQAQHPVRRPRGTSAARPQPQAAPAREMLAPAAPAAPDGQAGGNGEATSPPSGTGPIGRRRRRGRSRGRGAEPPQQ